jgi:hypothetical protein
MTLCKLKACTLLEFAVSGTGKIDKTAHVLRGVKVLGLESRNAARVLGLDSRDIGDAATKPYSYDPDAVKAAVPLYEGASVNLDHLASSYDGSGRRVVQGQRSTSQRFGRLVNVRFEDGLVADLEYLASHPMAATICEMAERMPEQIALSHHAKCVPEVRDGRVVIVQISAVESVDLIGERPGTTTSLFESEAPPPKETIVKKKIKEIVESLAASVSKTWLVKVLEMDGMGPVGEMPMEAPAAEASSDDQLTTAIKAMVDGVLDDKSLDLSGKLAKIKEILKAHEALTAKPEKPAEPPKEEDKAAAESLAAEKARYTALEAKVAREKKVRTTLESRQIRASERQIAAAVLFESDADRDAFIDEIATSSQPRPRSGGTGPETDTTPADHVPDPKKVAARLR